MQPASPWHPELFSQELRNLRLYLQVRQATLAEWADVSASQLSRWHAGSSRPGYDTLRKLLTAAIADRPDDDRLRSIAERLAEAAGYPRLLDPDVEEAVSPYTGAVWRVVKSLEGHAEDAGLTKEEEREMVERAMIEAEKQAELIADSVLGRRLRRQRDDE